MAQTKNKPKEWDYFTHVWKTESQYLSWVRGQIRDIWKTSPQRLEFLKSKKIKTSKYDDNGDPITFKNGKEKLYIAYVCEDCGKTCYDCDRQGKMKTYAVDHIKGNHSLVSFNQAPTFFEAMLRVNLEDLQILCRQCHDVKTYAERMGISLQDAEIAKIAIKLQNERKDKEFFTDRNLSIPSNAEKRKAAIIEILTNEKTKSSKPV